MKRSQSPQTNQKGAHQYLCQGGNKVFDTSSFKYQPARKLVGGPYYGLDSFKSYPGPMWRNTTNEMIAIKREM